MRGVDQWVRGVWTSEWEVYGPVEERCGLVDERFGPVDKRCGPVDERCEPADERCGPVDERWVDPWITYYYQVITNLQLFNIIVFPCNTRNHNGKLALLARSSYF